MADDLRRFFQRIAASVDARLAGMSVVPENADMIFMPPEWMTEFNEVVGPHLVRGALVGRDFEKRWVENALEAKAVRGLIEKAAAQKCQFGTSVQTLQNKVFRQSGQSGRSGHMTFTKQADPFDIGVRLPDRTEQEIRTFLDQRRVGLWGQVGDSTRTKLSNTIRRGIKKGDDLPAMRKRIQKVMKSYSDNAADRVAVTEATASLNAGSQVERAELGVSHKEWLSTIDSNNRGFKPGRFDHLRPDGQIQENQTPFNVSGQLLMFPADSSLGASAGNLINCRCCSASSIGNLIETLPPPKPEPVRPPDNPPIDPPATIGDDVSIPWEGLRQDSLDWWRTNWDDVAASKRMPLIDHNPDTDWVLIDGRHRLITAAERGERSIRAKIRIRNANGDIIWEGERSLSIGELKPPRDIIEEFGLQLPGNASRTRKVEIALSDDHDFAFFGDDSLRRGAQTRKPDPRQNVVDPEVADEFDRMSQWAKSGRTTPEQTSIARDMAGNVAQDVNERLLRGLPSDSVDAIDDWIAAHETTTTRPVYRGMGMTKDQADDVINRATAAAETGEPMRVPTYMSTSLDPSSAATFARRGEDAGQIMFEIKNARGVGMKFTSSHAHELEIMMARNQKFRVTRIIDGNDYQFIGDKTVRPRVTIQLERIDDDIVRASRHDDAFFGSDARRADGIIDDDEFSRVSTWNVTDATDDEIRTIKRWTESQEVNDSILDGTIDFQGPMKKFANDLEDVITKHGTTTDVPVYRGMKLTSEKGEEFFQRMKAAAETGEPVTVNTFQSTSMNPAVGGSFSRGFSKQGVVIEYKNAKGVGMRNVSKFDKEAEFLLNRNEQYRVTRIVEDIEYDFQMSSGESIVSRPRATIQVERIDPTKSTVTRTKKRDPVETVDEIRIDRFRGTDIREWFSDA